MGYRIILLYVWIDDPDLAKKCVYLRVLEGGHDIPAAVIERRYKRSIRNLFTRYLREVDGTFILDNSFGQFDFIARHTHGTGLMIFDADRVLLLQSQAKPE